MPRADQRRVAVLGNDTSALIKVGPPGPGPEPPLPRYRTQNPRRDCAHTRGESSQPPRNPAAQPGSADATTGEKSSVAASRDRTTVVSCAAQWSVAAPQGVLGQRDGVAHADVEGVLVDVEGALVQVEGRPARACARRAGPARRGPRRGTRRSPRRPCSARCRPAPPDRRPQRPPRAAPRPRSRRSPPAGRRGRSATSTSTPVGATICVDQLAHQRLDALPGVAVEHPHGAAQRARSSGSRSARVRRRPSPTRPTRPPRGSTRRESRPGSSVIDEAERVDEVGGQMRTGGVPARPGEARCRPGRTRR